MPRPHREEAPRRLPGEPAAGDAPGLDGHAGGHGVGAPLAPRAPPRRGRRSGGPAPPRLLADRASSTPVSDRLTSASPLRSNEPATTSFARRS